MNSLGLQHPPPAAPSSALIVFHFPLDAQTATLMLVHPVRPGNGGMSDWVSGPHYALCIPNRFVLRHWERSQMFMRPDPRVAKKLYHSIMVIFALAIMAGCATSPSPEEQARREKVRLQKIQEKQKQLEKLRKSALSASAEWITKRNKSSIWPISKYISMACCNRNEVRELLGPPDQITANNWMYTFVNKKGNNSFYRVTFDKLNGKAVGRQVGISHKGKVLSVANTSPKCST